uniref:Transport system permease n=1 Tax=Echinococcus granulosus TaxID=6210 RepID=A0A068WHE2_ECHGR|nr:hypothetical protein EgrG_000982300 [Echinococcus granulosus]
MDINLVFKHEGKVFLRYVEHIIAWRYLMVLRSTFLPVVSAST